VAHTPVFRQRRRPNWAPLIFIAVLVLITVRLGFGPWLMAAALLGLLPN
jgi:hypothetical protein